MKLNTRKIAATLSITAISALALTACGGEGGDTNGGGSADGPVTIEFWHSASGAAGEEMESLVQEFNSAHEGEINIKASYQGSYEDNISKFIASVQTGDLPALLQASDVQTTYLKDSGLITPAGDMAANDADYSFDNLIPVVSNYYTMEDTIYSMPAMVSIPTLYVNQDILNKAGVDTSDLSTSEGFLKAIKQIHEKTGKAGITFHQTGWFLEQSAASLGINWCNPDNGVSGTPADSFNLEDKGLREFWGGIGELYGTGAIANPGADGAAAVGTFTSGEAGILMNSSGAMGNIIQANPSFEWTSVALPRDNADAGSVPGGNSLWIVNEGHNENEQQAAWEFMKFIGSEESQKSIFEATGYLPTVNSAAGSLTDLKPQQESLLEQLETIPVNTSTSGCHTGALNDARTSYQTALSELSNGTDVDKAFDTAMKSTKESIESYNERAGK